MNEPKVRFSYSDEMFMRAVELGCTPVLGAGVSTWWGCRCPENVHGTTQMHPIITAASLDRARTWGGWGTDETTLA